jgi:hypothetical protein
MKVILIGNSPSVLSKQHGHTIDQFDIVVRLNDFKTKGYEKYVGSKTDILITNGSVNREYKNLSEINTVFVCCRSFQRSFQGIKNYIPNFILNETDNIFHSFNNQKTLEKCPTTGLYACLFLHKKYGVIETYGLNGLSSPLHYYDVSYPMDLTNHSCFLENKTFEYLIENNYILNF